MVCRRIWGEHEGSRYDTGRRLEEPQIMGPSIEPHARDCKWTDHVPEWYDGHNTISASMLY